MAEIDDALEAAGLTPNERKVYLELLYGGASGAGALIKRTGLSRQGAYDALDGLARKGLSGHVVRNKIKVFEASPPARILSMMKEREGAVEGALKQLLKIRKSATRDEVYFYQGKEGLKMVYHDILHTLKKNEEFLVLGGSVYVKELLGVFIDKFHEKRITKGIRFRILYNSGSRQRGEGVRKLKLTKVRYLPSGYSQPLEFNYYDGKAAILFVAKEKPMAVVIESDEISKALKSYFEFMWSLSSG